MSDRSLKIRDFQTEDLEKLQEIDRLCFPESIAFSRKDLVFCLYGSGSVARIAESSGIIAGFVMADIEGRQLAHILTLDVVPGLRRNGIGYELMRDIHRILRERKIEVSILEVGADNHPARRLYERMQYNYIGVLPGYYNNGGKYGSERDLQPYGSGDGYRMVLVL